MSFFFRAVKTRGVSRVSLQSGVSVVAALAAVALLSVVALGIQATAPVDHVLQPVDVEQSQSTAVLGVSQSAAAAAATFQQECKAGYDIYVDEQKGGTPNIGLYAVCLSTGSQPKASPFKGKSESLFGLSDDRCYLDPADSKYKPKKGWECRKIWCVPPDIQVLPTTGAGAKRIAGVWSPDDKNDKTKDSVCWDVGETAYGESVIANDVRARGAAQLLTDLSTPEEKANALAKLDVKLDPTFQSAIKGAFADDAAQNRLDVEALKKEQFFTQATLNDMIRKDSSGRLLTPCDQVATVGAIALSSTEDCYTYKNLDDKDKALSQLLAMKSARLKELETAASALDSSRNQNPDDSSCPPNEPYDPRTKSCHPFLPRNNVDGRPIADGGQRLPITSGPGGLGTMFGDPNRNANNTPQSPFGGACNTRYVCQGNTLYYQSANNFYGSSGQCMTQPIQQCQYGCQQMTQQSGRAGDLQTISAGLQVVSAITKLFGGGGGSNNSSVVNNNLPSSCATTPPQQQSPFGNGTNGQPCYQPPQQPDPAQCTSGQWKPTSRQGNGCTTGWQCVPTGGTGTGTGSPANSTTPTAQLSCQPKNADVGMRIGFSFSCGNATASKGTGFDTGGQLSGSVSSEPLPPPSNNNVATFTLTCTNQGVTTSDQCQVQVSKPGIIMVVNPQKVKSGETTSIGWITSGMQSCVISSPDQIDFSLANATKTNVNGSVNSSPITKPTRFNLNCVTLGQDTRQASSTVTMQ